MTDEQTQDENPPQEEETQVTEPAQGEEEESPPSNDSGGTPAEPPKPRGVQKRIDELTSNWRSAERDRDYWRELALQKAQQEPQAPEPKAEPEQPKPQADQYQSYEDYLEALADWRAEQKFSEYRQQQKQEAEKAQQHQSQQQKVQTFQRRAQDFASQTPDFQAVVSNPSLPITDAMQEAILDSDMGPQVAYHLGKHPDEAARISSLGPYAAAREIGRIEARLEIPPKPKVSQAPDPIRPVTGSGEGRTKTPDEMGVNEWMAWRQKQLQNR